jgi:hypothetical protein
MFALSFLVQGVAFVEPSYPTLIPKSDAPPGRPQVEGRLYLIPYEDLKKMAKRLLGYDMIPVLALDEEKNSIKAVTLVDDYSNRADGDFPPAPTSVYSASNLRCSIKSVLMHVCSEVRWIC